MQIAKNSDQFEKSVFVIVGNLGEYMPYHYIPLLQTPFSPGFNYNIYH